MAAESLKKLHTTLVDNRKGYEKAVGDAEPDVKSLFREMAALKEKDHAELHAGLTKLGEKPDESGSFMATVHKTVIGVRAATTGLGTNSLSSFVMGEKQVVEEYDRAIEECVSDRALVDTLTRQKQTLLAKIAQMERLAS
ncbi:PA2169 family four-helix-bundle protein [Bradyrhizobium manausense]|uniref:ferritin-like domain-containing protein n=1 Tax=Bradyrhizobium manausense TaxID=989370 RepID=UPI001BABD388|nr:PA2169 family four-helix-bundle protein [Bradyrhizobium manausense]MBR1092656.1 PA2169 family four-helix-bundle protein [Bradyrhizobium manausense]